MKGRKDSEKHRRFRSLGLWSLLFLTFSMLVIMVSVGGGERPISSYIATDMRTWLFGASAITIFTIGFGLYLLGFFAPHYDMSKIWRVMVAMILILLLLTAWLPFDGETRRAHDLSAWLMAYLAPVIVVDIIIETWRKVPLWLRIFGVAWFVAVVAFIVIHESQPETQNAFIWVQAAYLLGFSGYLMALTYRGDSNLRDYQ